MAETDTLASVVRLFVRSGIALPFLLVNTLEKMQHTDFQAFPARSIAGDVRLFCACHRSVS